MTQQLLAKYGTIGLVTYTGVNVTTFGTVYALVATGTADPIALLRRGAPSAERLGFDLTSRLDSLQATAGDGMSLGSTLIIALACTKLLFPVKLSVAAALLPFTTRLYARVRSTGLL